MSRTVIVSFGLRRHTRATLERAGRYGHPVHLVPAVPSATRGLRTHRSRLVTVHDEIGRAGLDVALRAAADDTVLLLHEDVLLDPDAAARLLEVAAGDDEPVVVPMLNHRDVDGAAGVLPPDVVQPLGPREEPRVVERIRPVVMAATGNRLRRLLGQRLTAGATRMHMRAGDALLVGEAIATHLDEGRDVTEPPVGPDGRPLLVASMIVRDEQEFLPGCLASLSDVVDRIDVCDTGSSDDTVAIAHAAGAQVIERSWRDDFAWARNEALELSRDAWWVLHVDADERAVVEDVERLHRFLATAIHDGEAFDVPLRDIATDGTDVGGMQLPRIFRPDDVHFVGAVHEVPRGFDGSLLTWAVCQELRLDHLGYQPHVIADRDKQARNVRIARADHLEHGNDITALQLARSLSLSSGNAEEILEIVEPLAARVSAKTDVLNEAGHIPVYQLYTRALQSAGRLEEAYTVIAEGRERYPHAALLRALHSSLGVATGRFDEVAALASADVPEAARPWVIPTADAGRLIDQAMSQLATDDRTAARQTLDELLASEVLSFVNRWSQVTSLIGVLGGDDALELLLDVAAADASGGALRAAITLLEEGDGPEFALETIRRTTVPGLGQAIAAVQITATLGDVERLGALDDLVDDDAIDSLWAAVSTLPAPVVQWLRTRATAADPTDVHEGDDGESALAALAAGDTHRHDRVVDWIDGAHTFSRARIAARDLPPPRAATVLADVVARGHDDPDLVRVALAVAAIAEDPIAIGRIGEHAPDALDEDVVARLVERAVDGDAPRTARALAGLLAPGSTVDIEGPRRSTTLIRLLGVHGGGLPAHAAVLAALGADRGTAAELAPVTPGGEPTAHRSVVDAAEELLDRLDGSWAAPPTVGSDADSTVVLAWVEGALTTVERLLRLTTAPVVWADPRTTTLLPLYDRVLDEDLTVTDLHVLDDPDRAVPRLAALTGLHVEHAARLWVRQVTDQLTARPHAPVLVTAALLAETTDVVDHLVELTPLTPDDDTLAAARAAAVRAAESLVTDVDAPPPGPWVERARATYAAAVAGDVVDALAAARAALDTELVVPPGRPLAVLGADTGADVLGPAPGPATVRLVAPDHTTVEEARALGWRVTTTDAHEAVRATAPCAVWVEEQVDLPDVVTGVLTTSPGTPIATPLVGVGDVHVDRAAAPAWLAAPPPRRAPRDLAEQTWPRRPVTGPTSLVITASSWDALERCLHAAVTDTDGPAQVVVVAAGGRDDGLVRRAASDGRIDEIVVADAGGGGGGSAITDEVLAAATGELVVLLDDGVIPRPGWLHAMRSTLVDGVAAVGPRTNRGSGPQRLIDSPAPSTPVASLQAWASERTATGSGSWPVERLGSFCVLFRRASLQAVGGVGHAGWTGLERRLSTIGELRVADGALVLRAPGATGTAGVLWDRLVETRQVDPAAGVATLHGIVLADDVPTTAASVDSLHRIGLPVTVLERGDVAATRAALAPLADAAALHELDWLASDATWEEVTGVAARSRLLLVADEVVVVPDVASARRGLDGGTRWALTGGTGARVVDGASSIDVRDLLRGAAPRAVGIGIRRLGGAAELTTRPRASQWAQATW